MSHQALLRALATVDGNQSEFSRRVGCSQQLVSYWIRNKKAISPEWVLATEVATGVSRHELRADLYPVERTTNEARAA